MSGRILFSCLLFSMLFCSCYLRQFKAVTAQKAELQKTFDSTNIAHRRETTMLLIKYDSITKEDLKKAALNQILEFQKDSLNNKNQALENEANDFVHRYVQLPKGAKFSSKTVIQKSKKYQLAKTAVISNVLYNPINLSAWGNLQYGDCVTAEEAFAKACSIPAIFIPDNVAIGWANENGVLNGAYLNDVLSKMKGVGFRMSGTTYNDGDYSIVDFRNTLILQNAISTGPVKIGLTSDQLERVWNPFRRGWLALGFQPEKPTASNSHCASLCGCGTLAWLAQQFNVRLPSGVDVQKMGYAIFTWGSIGIIDEQSLLAISHEAWIRNPTTKANNNVSSFILKAMGGEADSKVYLTHAFDNIGLHDTYAGGFGEMWICHDIGGGKIKLQARGKEDMFVVFLSHAYGKLELRGSYDGGSGEEWIIHNLPNGQIALEASGGEKGFYLSHAFGKLELRKNMEGGESWLNIGQQ